MEEKDPMKMTFYDPIRHAAFEDNILQVYGSSKATCITTSKNGRGLYTTFTVQHFKDKSLYDPRIHKKKARVAPRVGPWGGYKKDWKFLFPNTLPQINSSPPIPHVSDPTVHLLQGLSPVIHILMFQILQWFIFHKY